ncbi:chromosome partitioning protein ParA [Subsaximicrobium wynnwilliamsii]|uniref:Chromosome partitioning protein ParA n=1 Tax=Subsaximicrobium wynnwilliamsii TaxID=291179 RepID=A0A5C6ZHD6_9FLAO|nr:chromosome partitioning protein ParA [Subsaximicrobium wynnwilliamsii]TXD82954.1 chromosome partitioning protein ParA [Subsaximicrobium wynnwilliamsii]TXD88675.1 chromosome partitioning protein ParA [Subsaximicrobium wynnwilliamsii]TXE02768.1 chromosome partitioning protein ParA [Subsaximicrobium wynnwilliamsii]
MENSNANTSNGGSGLKIAVVILLVLFVGTGIYTFNLYKNNKENETALIKEKNQVMTDLNVMAKQYDVAIAENQVANEDLLGARERIQGLIDSLKVSQNSVNSLWGYRTKFNALQKEMDVLMAENSQLKSQNSLLSTSLDSTNVRLAERNMFSDSLLVQNTQLAEVVENAAVLQTVDLKGFGVIERNSGKLIPTERARRSDKIRVCFTIAKNALVGAGDKELYIQVLDPRSNVLGANEQIQFGEKILNYSLVSKFNYENRNLNICEFIAPNDEFEEGRYIVNVFNKKELISSTEFTLE